MGWVRDGADGEERVGGRGHRRNVREHWLCEQLFVRRRGVSVAACTLRTQRALVQPQVGGLLRLLRGGQVAIVVVARRGRARRRYTAEPNHLSEIIGVAGRQACGWVRENVLV